eukprot:jgi/Botrbrau1/1773/Bobra.0217s0028.1
MAKKNCCFLVSSRVLVVLRGNFQGFFFWDWHLLSFVLLAPAIARARARAPSPCM